MAKNITPKEKDFSQWYLDVIRAAELADYAPVRGCMVIRPTGFAVWESIREHFDREFKATGHVNAQFPIFIPDSFLAKEAEHVEGFAPECAVVTHAGGEKLEEPLVIRPTSETIIGHMYSKWVQSWRDLPILINQWGNAVRWEKRPRLFLRTSEFWWQEGHTAHASAREAIEETERMLGVYEKVMTEDLALPVIAGVKTKGERFPGAEETYTCEAMMSDTKAVQAGTSHYLGQNFAKAFDIKFQNKEGEIEYAYTTSWGVSTRLIGALIMTHSDNDGLVLPPRAASVKAVVMPICADETKLEESILPKAFELKGLLNETLGGLSVKVDTQFHMRPGDRFFSYLQKGVPLRLELGERELDSETVRAVRRDTGERINIPWNEAAEKIPKLLDAMQKDIFERAKRFRDEHTYRASNMEEFKDIIEKGGFAEAYFDGTPEDEQAIKEATGATPRCYPLDRREERGSCFFTGRDNSRLCVFAKAY